MSPTEIYLVAAIEALLAVSVIARNAYLDRQERSPAMAHSIANSPRKRNEPCEARIAPNCATSGPTVATVDRAPACNPCTAKARQDNNSADRRRG